MGYVKVRFEVKKKLGDFEYEMLGVDLESDPGDPVSSDVLMKEARATCMGNTTVVLQKKIALENQKAIGKPLSSQETVEAAEKRVNEAYSAGAPKEVASAPKAPRGPIRTLAEVAEEKQRIAENAIKGKSGLVK